MKTKTRQMSTGFVNLNCFFCRTPTRVDANTSAVLCSRCVTRLADAPPPPAPTVTPEQKATRKAERAAAKAEAAKRVAKASAGRGRGWHLKRLFEFDGQFYSFGELITADRARELRKAK